MKYLGLDIGTRRTGVAFLDDAAGVAVALTTLRHLTDDELVALVLQLAREKNADRLVIGLPLLPSGDEGSQAAHVRAVASRFPSAGLPCTFLDERYTTQRRNAPGTPKEGRIRQTDWDPDAASACQILRTFADIDRSKN